MFSFSLVNYPEYFHLSEPNIAKIFSYIAKNVPKTQKGILTIAFFDDEEIQRLNREYRGIDKTTDVLSFHYFEDFSVVDEKTDISGECIFSEAKILAQSQEYGHSPNEEFEILLIHSILHILGFDHETDEAFEKMWHYEKMARENFGLSVSR